MAKKKKIEKVTFNTPAERNAQLHKTMNEMNKRLGMNVIHFGKDVQDYKRISFGIPEIDEMFGGGVVRGLFTCLWGQEGSGKTTLAYYLTAQAQMEGLNVLFIALEPFDKDRATSIGVDVDNLAIASFPQAEQALDAIIDLAEKKLVDLVILDSIHSLSPKGEQENKKGDKSLEADTMALLARKLSQFFRMAANPVAKGNVAVILVGQTRTSIGFIAFEQLTGGNALKHYSVLILKMARGSKKDAPKHKEELLGFDCKVKITKTKTPGTKPELSEIHIPYYFDKGFDYSQPSAIGEPTTY